MGMLDFYDDLEPVPTMAYYNKLDNLEIADNVKENNPLDIILLLDKNDHSNRAKFMQWLDYYPGEDIYPGDKRSDFHIGSMTKNLDFVVYAHMVEFDALDKLCLTQAVSLYTYLFNELRDKWNRYNGRAGAHLGITSNIGLQIPVREYHCKFQHTVRFGHTDKYGQTLLYDNDNEIFIYPSGRIFVRTQEGNITEVNN